MADELNGIALDENEVFAFIYSPQTGKPVVFEWNPNQHLPITPNIIALSQYKITRKKVIIEFTRA